MPCPSTHPVRAVRLDDSALDAAFAALPPGTRHVLALLPAPELEGLPALAAAADRAGISVSGGVFPELIDGAGLSRAGAWLAPLPDDVVVTLHPDLPTDPAAAAAALADQVEPLLAPPGAAGPAPTLFLIFDALMPNIASVVDELYLRLADGVVLHGVSAGSESFAPFDCLFSGRDVGRFGALALLMPPRRPLTLAHGFQTPTQTLVATATQGNRILSIDWRPAFEVYQRLVADAFGVELTAENFYTFASHYPLGILRASGDLVARFPVGVEPSGALTCIGEIPPSAVLVLLSGGELDSGRCVAAVREGVMRGVDGAEPPPLLSFYCAGRRVYQGDRVGAELAALAQGTCCSAGALSLGEIGPLVPGGYPLFHNGAILSAAWPWG